MIDVRKHSSTHIEAKLTLPIPETKQRINLRYYIFSASQLHVSAEGFTPTQIARRMQSYGRYSSPNLTFAELLDEENHDSMLYAIRDYTAKIAQGTEGVDSSFLVYELQDLVNTMRHICRDLISSLRNMAKFQMNEDIQNQLAFFLSSVTSFKTRYYAWMRIISMKMGVSGDVSEAFRWADEAISLMLEERALMLLMHVKDKELVLCDESIHKLQEMAKDEFAHRQTMGYLSADLYSDKLLLRKAELKRWSQSVMYLLPKYSKWPKRLGQIFAGAAAAIAMTFATVASIFAENWFLKNSIQWALIVIIAYVFKDRIKEWLRAFFTRFLPVMMAEEIFSFFSPRSGRRLVKFQNSVTFPAKDSVDEDVMVKRKSGGNPFYDLLPEENILCYSRYLTLYEFKRYKADHLMPWIHSLTIIDRINISDFLDEMDDRDALHYFIKGDSVDSIKAVKNYNLHLIIEEDDKSEGTRSLLHYMIVVNKDGIERIEQI